MKKMTVRFFLLVIPLIFISLRAEAGIVLDDDFGNLNNWSILQEKGTSPDYYYITSAPEHLKLRTVNCDIWLNNSTTYNNLFTFKSPPAGFLANTFTMTMKLNFQPTSGMVTYPQVDLIAFDDAKNWIRAGYAYFGSNGKRTLQFCYKDDADAQNIGSLTEINLGPSDFYLRLTKENDVDGVTANYSAGYSTDGVNYTQIGDLKTGGTRSPAYLGFIAMVDANENNWADIYNVTMDGVPEPSVSILGLMGFGALAGLRRFKRKK